VADPLVTTRELNRAVLARQHLLERAELPLETAVEAVGALQAQYAPGPSVALWSRVRRVTLDGYAEALREYRLVTGLLMRGTLHVVSAGAYWAIASAVAGLGEGAASPVGGEPVDLEALQAHLAALVVGGPVLHAEVMAAIPEWLRRNGHDPEDPEIARTGRWAWRSLRGSTAVLNVHSRDVWGRSAPDAYVAAEAVLPAPGGGGPAGRGDAASAADACRVTLVRHHLRAFGPAAREDVASWVGASRPVDIQRALDALSPHLVTFRDEAGRLLYDLAEAPRPGAEVAAPPRYLAWFDSLLLAYAPRFRGRILSPAHRALVIRQGEPADPAHLPGRRGSGGDLEDRGKQAGGHGGAPAVRVARPSRSQRLAGRRRTAGRVPAA
jgi:Winged helix DNA-binding domain